VILRSPPAPRGWVENEKQRDGIEKPYAKLYIKLGHKCKILF